MSTTRDHILPVPKPLIGLRFVQLVTAVVILGLSAYGVTYLSFDGDSLMLFTAIATMIITVYIIAAELAMPVAYNYWAILGLDIFAIVFWIISFSLLASEVAAYQIVKVADTYCYYGYCYKKRDVALTKRTTNVYTYRNAMAAASGLGGLEFILFVVTLIFTAIHLHRHRKAGGHCMPNGANTSGVTYEPKPVELQRHNGQQPSYAAQPQHSGQQPVYAAPTADQQLASA